MDSCLRSRREPVELLLRRIALGALHGSLFLMGCSDESDGGLWTNSGQRVVGEDFDPCASSDGGSVYPVRASALNLAQRADYVAVRRTPSPFSSPPGEGEWTRTNFMTLSEAGTACATASTPACAEKVAFHPEQAAQLQCVQVCDETSIVTTRGDVVQRSATPSELVAQLGVIDSADEAMLLATSYGYQLHCVSGAVELNDRQATTRRVRKVEDGYEVLASKYTNLCPVGVSRYQLHVSAAGAVTEQASRVFDGDRNGPCIGRIPAGLAASTKASERSLGEHLAQCAHLEAASVFAFERLARELRAHGAPHALIARALQAAQDEVRHARVIGALARQHGVEPRTPELCDIPTRTLEEVALENAVEGCVRETYGAVVGAFQAARASDEEMRAAMVSIARDEARHAALSHEIHAWLLPQLSRQTQQQIGQAQQHMIAALHGGDQETEVRALAGLPSLEVARQMLVTLQRELWAPQAA